MSKKNREQEEVPGYQVRDDLTRKPLSEFQTGNNGKDEVEKSNMYPNLEIDVNGDTNEPARSKVVKKDQIKSLKQSTMNPQALHQETGEIYTKEQVFTDGSNDSYSEFQEDVEIEVRYELKMRKTIKPTQQPPKRIPQQQPPKSWKPIKLLLIMIVLGVASAIIACLMPWSLAAKPVLDVNAILSKLKPEFNGQPKLSFKVIKTALLAVSEPAKSSELTISTSTDPSAPSAPAIILLLAAQGAEELSRQIAYTLVEAVSANPLNISGAKYTQRDANSGKKEIDDLLRTLRDDAYGAVLVEDLHLIPGNIALMFHTYCDHENAPKKRVVYVMTVASGVAIPVDSRGRQLDEFVRERLSRSWSDIDTDQMEPLLTRLTVGVAAITPNQ